MTEFLSKISLSSEDYDTAFPWKESVWKQNDKPFKKKKKEDTNKGESSYLENETWLS